MQEQTVCPRCNRVGLVRLETVIKSGQSRLHYYCGACGHEWELTENGTAARKSDQSDGRPDHSRP